MNPTTKTCSKCGEEKPLTEFHRRVDSLDGRLGRCKVCEKAAAQAYRSRDPEKWREYRRTWYIENKEKQNATTKRHYHENRDWYRAYWAANRERQREKGRRYYQRHREKNLRSARVWRVNNPDKSRAIVEKYRARKRGSSGWYTAAQFAALCSDADFRCLCCGERRPLTADHVIPLARGGSNDIGNIQPLCQPCNSRKNTQIIDYRVVNPRVIPKQLDLFD